MWTGLFAHKNYNYNKVFYSVSYNIGRQRLIKKLGLNNKKNK